MLVIASANGRVGIGAAMDMLCGGGSALDAVEAGTRLVESNPDDHTVGFGGLPNLLGEVELDASIMDGSTLAAGAVAALKGFEHPVALARRVMTELPHVLLAAEGAARFADELGFERKELLTDEARKIWQARMRELDDKNQNPDTPAYLQTLARWVHEGPEAKAQAGTVDFIAIDGQNNIASAVSTSGIALHYPGRVGDSPIIGAGNYADTRHGACAFTGRGEMSIRTATAHTVVTHMRAGMSSLEACHEAAKDLKNLDDAYRGATSFIAVDRHGNHCGVSNRDATYVYQDESMAVFAEVERTRIDA